MTDTPRLAWKVTSLQHGSTYVDEAKDALYLAEDYINRGATHVTLEEEERPTDG